MSRCVGQNAVKHASFARACQLVPVFRYPSAPALSIHYHASNLVWRFVSHMILYMFQCHSPKSSHPLPLPQSPEDCSIHQCLFCCLAYRVIVTIFLNSIYMRQYTVLVFFFLQAPVLTNQLDEGQRRESRKAKTVSRD